MGIFNGKGYQGGGSVEEEMKRSKVKGWTDVILCVVIVLVVLLYRGSIGRNQNTVIFDRDGIVVVSVEGEQKEIAFDAIEDIELRSDFESFDKGELIQGQENKNCLSGAYRNAEFGDYFLFVNPKFENYIIVTLPDGVIVLNYESRESTVDAYHFLMQASGRE